MPTLVLAPRFSSDSQRLWRAAVEAGWSIEHVMGSTITTRPVEPAIYGETLFAQKVALDLGHALIEPPEDWLLLSGAGWLKRIIHFGNLSEAFNLVGPTFVKLLRPMGDRGFPARVYKNGKELREVAAKDLSPSLHVFMSEPVAFEVEYRTFLLNGKVVTASVYMRGGKPAEVKGGWPCDPEELSEAVLFAHEVAYKMGGGWYRVEDRPLAVDRDGDIKVPPAFVLDVGKIKDKGWAIVGAKPAWASGICGCDEKKVLDVIRRSTVSLPAMDDDVAWVPHTWS